MSQESDLCDHVLLIHDIITPALVLGCRRCIDVYRAPNLKLLCSIQQHHKIINTLRWHPEHGSSSQLHGLLASGSSNAIVYVHDLRSIIGERGASEAAPIHTRGPPQPGSHLQWTAIDPSVFSFICGAQFEPFLRGHFGF